MKILKRILKTLGILIGTVVLLAVGLFGYLTITEYRPADVEPITVQGSDAPVFYGSHFRVLSWNVGYCALGAGSDFFMDGGKQTRPDSEAVITTNMENIGGIISTVAPDFCMLQEVDSGSKRSYFQQEVDYFTDLSLFRTSAYAYNFKCNYVPYPLPTIGKVQSGLLTMSAYAMGDAERIALPCPFSWPVSTANLKRCLLVTRIPLDGTDKQLVLVNLHLEAYDDGEGKIAQTRQLLDFLHSEYAKGNYVVAGGDWNQIFPDSETTFPNSHRDLWTPGVLERSTLEADGWQLLWGTGSVPTCRLLNQPYDPADTANTQYYVIDGFLVSPNLRVVSVETLDEGFAYSDHNPVLLELQFGE